MAAEAAPRHEFSPEVELGRRLFAETRFAQFFFSRSGGDMNVDLRTGDPVLATLASAETAAGKGSRAREIAGLLARQTMSCRACHLGGEMRGVGELPASGVRTFGDFAVKSPVPEREDGRRLTPRNSPALVEVLETPSGVGAFHFDGEFATAEELVKGTFLGRNFGWLPGEETEAKRHFARVIREDDGKTTKSGAKVGEAAMTVPYAVLLRGVDATIPAAWRLPETARLDPARASDEEILAAGARMVVAYLRTLRFSRDAEGRYDGSPYDAFLALNRLPRAPAANQTPHEYARRLGEAVAALRVPRFVDEPERRLKLHDQAFRFGDRELRGMRIFFRDAIGAAQTGGAGNCAECHVPPRFTDFQFHNTGVAQEAFDAREGRGAFAKLVLPGVEARATEFERWLAPTAQQPRARGDFLIAPGANPPELPDLGLWAVYGNPDLPGPQPVLERILNPGRRWTRDEVLERTVGRFKTSTVRALGQSAPYLHTGGARTLEEVVQFYRRASALAREGTLRNAPPEFFGMRLEADDVEPLVAFMRALNEDFGAER